MHVAHSQTNSVHYFFCTTELYEIRSWWSICYPSCHYKASMSWIRFVFGKTHAMTWCKTEKTFATARRSSLTRNSSKNAESKCENPSISNLALFIFDDIHMFSTCKKHWINHFQDHSFPTLRLTFVLVLPFTLVFVQYCLCIENVFPKSLKKTQPVQRDKLPRMLGVGSVQKWCNPPTTQRRERSIQRRTCRCHLPQIQIGWSCRRRVTW